MHYITNVPLVLQGERVEKGQEVELTEAQAAALDPKDITPVSAVHEEEEEANTPVPVEEMTMAQLKARAKELDLPTTGSKADLVERIKLHLSEQV